MNDRSEESAYPFTGMGSDGLTKREWFIGMAMQGMMASDLKGVLGEEKVAQLAVACADATLKAAGIYGDE